MLNPEESGAGFLESLEPRAHNESVRAQHLAKGLFELGLKGTILGPEIKERNGNHSAIHFSHRLPARATSFLRRRTSQGQEQAERCQGQCPELSRGQTQDKTIFGRAETFGRDARDGI